MNSIWVLGKQIKDESQLEAECRSFFRFTYRRDMPAFSPYDYLTSDAGWGCMIRAGQMIMAHTYRVHLLGRDWKAPVLKEKILKSNPIYKEILSWFVDHPGYPHFYAIHHLVQCGMKYDKLPGEWFGPSTISLVLRDLVNLHSNRYHGSLSVLVTQGNVIYIKEAEKICSDLTQDNLEDTLLAFSECKDTAMLEKINQKLQRLQSFESIEASTETLSCKEPLGISIDSVNNKLVNNVEFTPSVVSNGPSQQQQTSENRLDSNHSLESDQQVVEDASGINLSDASQQDTSFVEKPIPPQSLDQLALPASPFLLQASKNPIHSERFIQSMMRNFFDPLCNMPPSHVKPWIHSLLVMIPLRLGIHSVNKEYYEEITEMLRNPNCVGILGGRVNHAIYFVGYEGDQLLGLDPHTVYANPSKDDMHLQKFPEEEYLSQIHTQQFVRLRLDQLDPSMAFAFYFSDREAFQSFADAHRTSCQEKMASGRFPLFTIEHSPPTFDHFDCPSSEDEEDGLHEGRQNHDKDIVSEPTLVEPRTGGLPSQRPSGSLRRFSRSHSRDLLSYDDFDDRAVGDYDDDDEKDDEYVFV